MTTLIELITAKLGLADEKTVQSKTTELLRLLELRSSSIPPQINEYGKVVLCADIAAEFLSISIDKENALKVSGLRKSQYSNYKRIFEKLLDVNQLAGTKSICIKLGLSGVNQRADELLALYTKHVATENPDLDINHPQYAAMAIFQACKIMKQKISKPKILGFSMLRPTQWAPLEQRWDKFLSQHYHNKVDSKSTTKKFADLIINEGNKKETTKDADKRQKHNASEDYEDWKRRILEMAEKKLKLMESSGCTKEEKENL